MLDDGFDELYEDYVDEDWDPADEDHIQSWIDEEMFTGIEDGYSSKGFSGIVNDPNVRTTVVTSTDLERRNYR